MPYYFVDRVGQASEAYGAAQWSELFRAAHIGGWNGVHPFNDVSAYDHWQLDQANVTLTHQALERTRYMYKRTLPRQNVFRERRDRFIGFLTQAQGDVWLQQLLVELCPQCGAAFPNQAAFCISCGYKLQESAPPPRSPHTPALGQTQRLA